MGENVQIIHENIARNHLQNVTIESAAVGDTDGMVQLIERTNSFIEPKRRFSARAVVNKMIYSKTSVPSIRLDTYCGQHGIQPDVLKIDVEGFEVAVLRGAQQVMASCPKILLEVHPAQIASFDETLDELIELLGPDRYQFSVLYEDDRYQTNALLTSALLSQRLHLFAVPVNAAVTPLTEVAKSV